MPYSGNSIVDYLSSTGQKSDYASRSQLAQSKGITNYTGTAEQNTTLLNMLKSGSPNPVAPAPQQAPKPQTTPAPAQATMRSATEAGTPGSAQDLVNMGYAGYAGWGNAEAVADFKATQGIGKESPSAGGGIGAGMGMNQPTIDLPGLYKSLTDSSGVSQLDQKLVEDTKAFNAAVSKINDNPFLSEANRVGRIQKLQTDFNNATAGIRADIATRKADIETQLNLQSKQFDINSQQAKVAQDQFNSLLAAGALDNATGEDIANITKATGLSSSLIQSAIQAKKISGYTTTTQSFDDGSEEGFIIYTIDQQGNVVNQVKQVTGKSSKASVSYSTDPAVSSFISQFVNQGGGSAGLEDQLWEQAGYSPINY